MNDLQALKRDAEEWLVAVPPFDDDANALTRRLLDAVEGLEKELAEVTGDWSPEDFSIVDLRIRVLELEEALTQERQKVTALREAGYDFAGTVKSRLESLAFAAPELFPMHLGLIEEALGEFGEALGEEQKAST